jgi:hypothetical protein
VMSVTELINEKRQRTAAVQDAVAFPGGFGRAPAFGLRQSSGALESDPKLGRPVACPSHGRAG